ncbi:hypothetical protein QZH41_011386, partial [Actinostola sp. cb2023]
VFEQGVSAISYSVDLWVHYLNFSSQITKGQVDGPQIMRSLFERAILTAGHEYRSDKLWDAFLEWERSQGQLKQVTDIYDNLLTVPTQHYAQHFEKFKTHINSNPVAAVLSTEELLKLRSEVAAAPPGVATTAVESPITTEPESETDEKEETKKDDDEDDDEVAPGTENLAAPGDEPSQIVLPENDPETVAIREKVIAARAEVYSKLEEEIRRIWVYEEGIKRPYFHVKPLERVQLKNWKDYLDFEIAHGDHGKIVALFERCVIACALYEEFWQKYASYIESHSLEECHNVYEKACYMHLPRKPNIHLSWAAFEEQQGNQDLSAKILKDLDVAVPGLTVVKIRRINLERRRGSFENTSLIYQEAMEETADDEARSFYAVRYARFLAKVLGDSQKASGVLKDAIEKDKLNKRLYLQLLDLELSLTSVNEDRVEEVFEVVKSSDLSEDAKLSFSQRRLDFLEDFSTNINKIMKANEAHNKLYKPKSSCSNGTTASRKRPSESNGDEKAKVSKADEGVVDTSQQAYQVTPAGYQVTVSTGTEAYDTTYSASYSAAAAAAYSYTTPVQSQWAGYTTAQPAAYNYNQWYYGQTAPTT